MASDFRDCLIYGYFCISFVRFDAAIDTGRCHVDLAASWTSRYPLPTGDLDFPTSLTKIAPFSAVSPADRRVQL